MGEYDLEPGSVFAGRYRVEGMIGRGGMGAVYRAHDLAVGDEVALKLLRLEGRPTGPAIRRFQREVRLARKVTHRNVSRTFDLGRDGERFYLTMELVDGQSLAELLRAQRRLPVAQALRYAACIADGLAAAHEQSVIHRDLKPGNVLVEHHTERVVITDFGVARSTSASDSEPLGASTAAIGTLHYMAPEQLAGASVDERTDLYSLGVVLEEMILGRAMQTMRDGLALAAPLGQLVDALRAASPDDRPRSAAEVARTLRRIDATLATTASPERPEPNADDATFAEQDVAATTGSVRIPPFLPLPLQGTAPRVLAVLPFKARAGGESERELASGLFEELTDLLAHLQGVDTLASGATAHYAATSRSLKDIAAELGVDWLVEGTLRSDGQSVRLVVRLVEAQRAVQLWSERFEGRLDDVLAFEERMAQRVAEALRVEIASGRHERHLPAEAVACYLRGRRKMTQIGQRENIEAVEELRRALELAPDYEPALAGMAVALTYAWFLADVADLAGHEQRARDAVELALERGAELAETQLAAGFFHAQRGEYRRAVEHLARSLEIAPTYAVAHEYLGHLQCEAGLAEEGVRRIELATRLEPTLVRGRSDVARHHALHGRYEAFETAMREAERLCGETAPLMVIHIRVALWRGDFERAERYRERLPAEVQYALLTRFLTQYAFGEIDAEQADATFSAMQLAARANPRLAALAAQAMAEMHGVRDEAERALAHVVRAADGVLTDIDWLDHCPVLARARTLAGFDEARRRVERRALDIWTPRPRL